MKKTRSLILITTALVLTLAITVPADAQRRGPGRSGRTGQCSAAVTDYFDQLDVTPLTQSDIDSLNLMREEEKLARDVYQTLGDRWSLPIFFTIARAEQRHMDRVLSVLNLYEVPDPVADDTVGVFVNPELAGLYETLVDRGSRSLVDGLSVGATIEDLDIKDLTDLIRIGANDHLLFAWQNLAKGSRNHLRAFIAALDAQDAFYQPQYLDQGTFDAILAGEWERGIVYDATGAVLAECGGRGRGRGMGRNGSGTGACDGSGGTGTRCGNCDGAGSGNGSCDGSGSSGSSGGNGNGGNQDGNGTGNCDGTGRP